MTIRHVAMFKFTPEFPQSERERWAGLLRELPAKVPFIQNLSVGFDVLGGARSWDAVVVCEFETLDEVRAYADHPDHVPIGEISGPNSEVIASVDFVLD